MATSDLCEVLKRHSGGSTTTAGDAAATTTTTTTSSSFLDSNTERQICTAVLRLLHDKSNDVQAIAVKTLGVLITTVHPEQVLEIADSLTDQVLDASKSELRDVYTIGLRTLVKTIPHSSGNAVAHRLVSRLLDGIRTSTTTNTTGTTPTTTLATDEGEEVIVLCCLDVLTDLLGRFGGTAVAVTRQHEAILQMCLTLLGGSTTTNTATITTTTTTLPVVRKRSGNTLACLSSVLSDALLMRMVESLLTHIDRSATTTTNSIRTVEETRALIRTMCAVAGAVGHRLGQEQMDRIIPIFLRFTNPTQAITGDDDDEDDDEAEPMQTNKDEDGDEPMMDLPADDDAALLALNELRESCFMGLESFVLRCPKQVEPHLTNIIQAALAYMSYDPNYSYGSDPEEDDNAPNGDDDEDNDDADDDEEDEYEEDDDDEDEEEDDDDESWKVRRGAVRALKAVVEAKKHDPAILWLTSFAIRKQQAVVAAALVNRFKEREENCRVGVIDCFTRLLAVTIAAASDAASATVVSFASTNRDTPPESTTTTKSMIDLNKYRQKIVKECEKILSTKKGNERSKSSCLALLATLCKAPGGVGSQAELTSVFQHVEAFLASPQQQQQQHHHHREGTISKALRLDALSLVHVMLASDNHSRVHVRICLHQTLLPQLCQGVNEQWYKVIAQALQAIAFVPRFFVVGYSPEEQEQESVSQERSQVAEMIFKAVEPKLAAHDVDQEIKECALKASASLLSYLHPHMSDQHKTRLLQLLLERLKNETTRISAIKNVATIAAASGLNSMQDNAAIDLSPILADSIAAMSSFLKLQSRSLKQSTLEALDIIVTNHGSYPEFRDGQLFSKLVQDITHLIVDSDLHLSHLALECTDSILEVCPACGPAVKEHVLEPALKLSTSSLLQDMALDSLLAFFKQVTVTQAVPVEELLASLRQRLKGKMGKNTIYNLSKCIAIVTASSGSTKQVLDEIFELLESETAPDGSLGIRRVQLSLLITGDLGRITDLGESADRLKQIYMSTFESSTSEDLKHAAAYALGNAAVGSPTTLIPAIIDTLKEDNKKQQYLLLSALREFIKCSAKNGSETLSASLSDLIGPLEEHCADPEEGVRTMVAECFGSLSCLRPETMLPKLKELQTLHSEIVAPEGMIGEEDEASKKNSLVCWTVATSVKLAIAGKVDPLQLAPHMSAFVSLLNQTELTVRTAALLLVYSAAHHMPQVVVDLMQDSIVPALFEVSGLKLQREVDLGPFKHKVDDAIPLRKAALSIFSTSLETLPGSLDMASFMPVLARALGDAEDIQLHAHQIVISMCSRHPSYVVNAADAFIEPLEKTLKKKAGQKQGPELERYSDWIKSALRVAVAVSKVEGVMSSHRFAEFMDRIQKDEKFMSKLQALAAEQ